MKSEKLFKEHFKRLGSEIIMLKVSCQKNIFSVAISRGRSKASLQNSGVKVHVSAFEDHYICTNFFLNDKPQIDLGRGNRVGRTCLSPSCPQKSSSCCRMSLHGICFLLSPSEVCRDTLGQVVLAISWKTTTRPTL